MLGESGVPRNMYANKRYLPRAFTEIDNVTGLPAVRAFSALICDKRTCTTRTYSFAAALTKVQMTQIIYRFWRRKPISFNY